MRLQMAMAAVVLLAGGCVRQSRTQTLAPVRAP